MNQVVERTQSIKERETWLDLGRVISLLVIVLRHTAVWDYVALAISPFFFQRLPFLFLAAGYFVGRRDSFEYVHSPCRYLPLYFVWNVIAFILFALYHIYNGTCSEFNDISLVISRLFGVGNPPWDFPLWFLRDVMFLSICFPIFAYFRRIGGLIWILLGILLFDSFFYSLSDSTFLFESVNHHTLAWIFFFGLGFYFGKHSLSTVRNFLERSSVFVVPLFLLGGVAQVVGLYYIDNQHIAYLLWGVIGLSCICVCLCKMEFFRKIARVCSPVFFFIFVCNCSVISFFEIFIPRDSKIFWFILPLLLFITIVWLHRWIKRNYPFLLYWLFGLKNK